MLTPLVLHIGSANSVVDDQDKKISEDQRYFIHHLNSITKKPSRNFLKPFVSFLKSIHGV